MQPGWTRTAVGGKPLDVFDPPGGGRPRASVLFLHAVGQESLADNAAWTAELARLKLPCAAPRGGYSWWAARVCADFDPTLTAERYLLDVVVPWMRERWNVAINGLAAAGVSMGGQGAVRLALKHPDVFPVAASVAGAFDHHEWHGRGTSLDAMYRSREACRQDSAVLHVHPSRHPPHLWFACDPDDTDWFRGNDRLHEKLSAVGVPHVADLTTRAGGHSWAYFDAMAAPALAFVGDALAKAQRSLM